MWKWKLRLDCPGAYGLHMRPSLGALRVTNKLKKQINIFQDRSFQLKHKCVNEKTTNFYTALTHLEIVTPPEQNAHNFRRHSRSRRVVWSGSDQIHIKQTDWDPEQVIVGLDPLQVIVQGLPRNIASQLIWNLEQVTEHFEDPVHVTEPSLIRFRSNQNQSRPIKDPEQVIEHSARTRYRSFRKLCPETKHVNWIEARSKPFIILWRPGTGHQAWFDLVQTKSILIKLIRAQNKSLSTWREANKSHYAKHSPNRSKETYVWPGAGHGSLAVHSVWTWHKSHIIAWSNHMQFNQRLEKTLECFCTLLSNPAFPILSNHQIVAAELVTWHRF